MDTDNKVLEFCSIYSIIFLVNDDRQRKISKTIVCSSMVTKAEVQNLISEKFARVLSVVQVNKVGDGIKFHTKNFNQEFRETEKKIRIETFWEDVEVLSMEYLNEDGQVEEHNLFVISVSEADKKQLAIKIEQQFKEVKSIYRFTDCLEALSLKE